MVNNNKRPNLHAADHMANERTFLAWIRTSLGVMAFGFVVEKFSLFIKQLSLLLGHFSEKSPPYAFQGMQGYSSSFGIFLIALGTVLSFLAFIKYRNNQAHIDKETYTPNRTFDVMLTLIILVSGVFLIGQILSFSSYFIY